MKQRGTIFLSLSNRTPENFDQLTINMQIIFSTTLSCSAAPQKLSALLLLMLGVFADHHDLAFSLDDLALLTNGFN